MTTLALAPFSLTTIALAVSFVAATLTGTVKDPFCRCTTTGGIGGTGIYGPTASSFDAFLTTNHDFQKFRFLLGSSVASTSASSKLRASSEECDCFECKILAEANGTIPMHQANAKARSVALIVVCRFGVFLCEMC
jgi:hypothetical protein